MPDQFLIGELREVMRKAEKPITYREVVRRLEERGVTDDPEEGFGHLQTLGIVKEAGRKGFWVIDKEQDDAYL